MATTAPPELHDGRDGHRELYKLVNWLRRQALILSPGIASGVAVLADGIATGTVQLVAVDATALIVGTVARVVTVGDNFQLVASSTTADNITRVDAFNKAGYQWERMATPNVDWLASILWSVYSSPTGGSDENDGQTDGTALQTMGELARRTRYPIGYYVSTTAITIRVIGGVAALTASEAAILTEISTGLRVWTTIDV